MPLVLKVSNVEWSGAANGGRYLRQPFFIKEKDFACGGRKDSDIEVPVHRF
jgi:hypothetical protein